MFGPRDSAAQEFPPRYFRLDTDGRAASSSNHTRPVALTIALDHINELVEQRRGVVRAGACFGMILDRINRMLAVREPFNGVVVEVYMRDLAIAAQRIRA